MGLFAFIYWDLNGLSSGKPDPPFTKKNKICSRLCSKFYMANRFSKSAFLVAAELLSCNRPLAPIQA